MEDAAGRPHVQFLFATSNVLRVLFSNDFYLFWLIKSQVKITSQLTAIKCFEAAARLGSFSAAAEELSVSAGAVSRQIGQLERSLSLLLFHRSHRRVTLTDEGSRLSQDVIAAFDLLRRAERHLDDHTANDAVVLAAPASFLLRWLIPRMRVLQSVLGDTPLRVATWDKHDGPIDPAVSVSVRIGEVDPPSGFTVIPFMAEEFGLVVNPKILSSGQSDVRAEVLELPRIVPKTRPNIWQRWSDESGVALAEAEIIEFEHMFFSLEAAEACYGVAVGPRPYVLDAIASGRLIAPFGFVRRPGSFCSVIKQTSKTNRNIQKTVSWLEEQGRIIKDDGGSAGAHVEH